MNEEINDKFIGFGSGALLLGTGHLLYHLGYIILGTTLYSAALLLIAFLLVKSLNKQKELISQSLVMNFTVQPRSNHGTNRIA